MKALFEVTPFDRTFYERRLRNWLPERIIDVHTHVWLKTFNKYRAEPGQPSRTVVWPSRVANENPVEHLLETYRLLFPGKAVLPLMFATLAQSRHLDAVNAYVAGVSRKHGFPALIFSDPRWPAEVLEQKIRKGGFLGIKSYYHLVPAYLPSPEIRIYDYFPPHQLELMNRHGWIVMLHIPRNGRLRDPVNLTQMCEIEKRYPNLQLVIAHVGRAYCPDDIGDAFKVLSKTKRMHFDVSANTNAVAFQRLLETVGPKRVLFGSDMPVLRMRTRRICERGFYVNLVPKGLYGDVSTDAHMREVTGEQAEKLTFFMYEELDALRRAALAAGVSRVDLQDVFYNNAARIIRAAGGHV